MFTLDFEASGLNLGLSYPIEVGYTNGKLSREMLIKPAPNWWWWSYKSEEIHGISQNELLQGLSVVEVCNTINQDLLGENVLVDGYMYDKYWLTTLYEAAGLKPTFQLSQITDKEWFLSKHNISHRALADARQLWRWVN